MMSCVGNKKIRNYFKLETKLELKYESGYH